MVEEISATELKSLIDGGGNVQMIDDWKQYPTIKFTLPGAPDDDGKTFEDNLRKWLTPYLPRATKQSTRTEQPL